MAKEPVHIEMPSWSPEWHEDAVEIGYQESLRIQEIQSQWSDAIDSKVVAVFTVGSVIVTLIPTFHRLGPGLPSTLWLVASAFWLLAAIASGLAFHPRALEIGPNPSGFLEGRWLSLNANEFRLCRLSELGESYAFNRDKLGSKALWLQVAMYLTAAEVLCLILALSFDP